MLTEKQKTKIFNKSLNVFRDSRNLNSTWSSYLHTIIEELKKEKQNLINNTFKRSDELAGKTYLYEKRMLNIMEEYIKTKVRKSLLKSFKKDLKGLVSSSGKLKVLLNKIEEGRIPKLSNTYSEWGGAGIIITSDPDRNHYESDLFIVLKKPRPIVWIMIKLSDACSGYLTYMNKEGFFYDIASIAEESADKEGNFTKSEKHILKKVVLKAESAVCAELKSCELEIERITSDDVFNEK